ncbi:hypothetical protein NEOLI_001269 [Neolecta irregularis DAH-3]|uniref:Uncharacterized protein n=1 Tax=Neolecta irregularis (strain DAH-3) TaxID=1198029 RepID=A0A1U7LUW3_NEOID|nr:hypothetical protein NEOLI_001269 [Neolecta irregularis DAH-3]|eukprot:OLL26434.1 hypothetical protein NEOLI_001269 [Neolecta irregularis DAH-3]
MKNKLYLSVSRKPEQKDQPMLVIDAENIEQGLQKQTANSSYHTQYIPEQTELVEEAPGLM